MVNPKKKSKCPKIIRGIQTNLSIIRIDNNVRVTGIRMPTKTIVKNGIVKIVSNKVAPHGKLVEAATTIVAKVVIDKVSGLLK